MYNGRADDWKKRISLEVYATGQSPLFATNTGCWSRCGVLYLFFFFLFSSFLFLFYTFFILLLSFSFSCQQSKPGKTCLRVLAWPGPAISIRSCCLAHNFSTLCTIPVRFFLTFTSTYMKDAALSGGPPPPFPPMHNFIYFLISNSLLADFHLLGPGLQLPRPCSFNATNTRSYGRMNE